MERIHSQSTIQLSSPKQYSNVIYELKKSTMKTNLNATF
jgi:hypothetical protein